MVSSTESRRDMHADADLLALAALGEAVDEQTRAHLSTCADCGQEVDSLRRVVALGRGATALEEPSAGTWSRIAEELGLQQALPSVPGHEVGSDTASLEPSRAASPSMHRAARRTSRRTAFALAACVAGAAVGVGGTLAVQQLGADPAGPTVVAKSSLGPIGGSGAGGTIRMVQSADGSKELEVTLTHAAGGTGDGFHEVWMADPQAQKMVALGVLQGSTGTFAVPAGVTLATYPLVDISLEPYDGDPAHSATSVARGVFPT